MIYTLAFAPELNIKAKAGQVTVGRKNVVEWEGGEVYGCAERVSARLDENSATVKRLYFVGGKVGDEIKRLLKGKDCEFFKRKKQNALRITLSAGKESCFVDDADAIEGNLPKELFERLSTISGDDVLVMPECFQGVISDEKLGYVFSATAAASPKTIVRLGGANLKTALKYAPYCIVVDLEDVNAYFGAKFVKDSDVISSISMLQKKGAQAVIVLNGKKLFASGDMGGIYRAERNETFAQSESRIIAEFARLTDDGVSFENALEAAINSVIEQKDQQTEASGAFTIVRQPIKTQAIRNIAHYVKENADVTFEEKRLTLLDIAVFSQLTMLDIKKLPDKRLSLRKARKKYIDKNPDGYVDLGVIVPQTFPLLSLCADSKRFSDVEIVDCTSVIDDERVVQFTAITFLLPTGEYCVCFNGTDDTIVGWKEDFYLLYDRPTESQARAAEYLSKLADSTPPSAKIFVAGHSKGGNLSMYGAARANADLQSKLVAAINFDGPGFTEKFYKTADFKAVRDKITSVIPQLSVIGRLFNHEERVMIVKSCFSGMYQHDLFSWETQDDMFVLLPKLDELSDKVQVKVAEIMSTLTDRQKKVFIDGLFSLLYSTDSFTLTQLMKNRGKLFGNFFKCDLETRRVLLSMMTKMLSDRYVREMIIVTMREAKKMQEKKQFEEISIVSGKINNAIESIGMVLGDRQDESENKSKGE